MNGSQCDSKKIKCGSVWGGIKNADQDIETSGLKASLYSQSYSGGKGGDIYYFSVCQGDVLTRIAMADVVGHGDVVSEVSECVYSSMLRFLNNPESSSMLKEWNQTIEQHGIKALTTAAVGGVVVANKKLHYSYAGHHPFLILKKNSKHWRPMNLDQSEKNNFPLGVDVESEYDQNDLSIEQGDKLFLYTDGLIEAPNQEGEEYGINRLVSQLDSINDSNCKEIKDQVLHSVRSFSSQELNHDDVTLMAIEF